MFKKGMEDSLTYCSLFIVRTNSRMLFGLQNKKITNVKSFLGYMNSILKDCGLMINHDRKIGKTKSIGKHKSISIINYSLKYLDDIQSFL